MDLGYDRIKVFDAFYNEKLKAEIQHNYLKVNIYFQTLNVREIEQTPKYSVSLELVVCSRI